MNFPRQTLHLLISDFLNTINSDGLSTNNGKTIYFEREGNRAFATNRVRQGFLILCRSWTRAHMRVLLHARGGPTRVHISHASHSSLRHAHVATVGRARAREYTTKQIHLVDLYV